VKPARLIIILSAILLYFPHPTDASEFGNIFFPEVEKDSRAASAQALKGIEGIFVALRQRELKEIENGSKSFFEAARSLRMASEMMKRIKIPADSDRNINWDSLSDRDRRFVNFVMKTLGRKQPNKLSGMYSAFANLTARLGDLLGNFVKGNRARSAEPIMPDLSNEITIYIQFGVFVTRIARL
jgi:hypothetical protein|tara:strand:- start:1258 stop:1809 length:552 start_codon:yes stop_codon:yes gene_type:complete